MKKELNITVGSLALKNPLIAASGTYGYGVEFQGFYPPSLLGAIIVKGVSLQPLLGNATPRLSETPAGLINAIGLQNPGLEAFIAEKIPLFAKLGVPIFVNLFGGSIEEFEILANRLDPYPEIAGFEVNISCPNVKGEEFASSPRQSEKVVKAVRRATKKPVWIKLAPYAPILIEMAKGCEDAGADALTVANTYPSLAIDTIKKKPVLGNLTGGLSGPAIKPLTLYLVWKAYQAVNIPIVASGGVFSARDVIEYLMAGARAVQFGTVSFVNPMAGKVILEEFAQWFEQSPYNKLEELSGLAHG